MRKIIIIGIDGADWRVINFLLKYNKLPTLSGLIHKGISKTLHNANGIESDPWSMLYVYREYVRKIPRPGNHPDVSDWTTLATGVMPDKHGLNASTTKNANGIEIPTSFKKKNRRQYGKFYPSIIKKWE